MTSPDSQLIQQIVQDTGRYLDCLQRKDLLWADLNNHIAASHIAECLGDTELVARHLQAATYLLLEINLMSQQPIDNREFPH